MGVWHVGGMGVYPGVVTVPLSYVYLLLRASAEGDGRSREFFRFSGEATQDVKGAPECLIIFTSREVISGRKNNSEWEHWKRIDVRDEWFSTEKQSTAPKTIARYLSNLFKVLKSDNFKPFFESEWIKDTYFLEVNHEDFMDCFAKIGVTVNALKDKEIWVNMIGGTNQINTALLTAGSFFAVAPRYYYVFQSQPNVKLLHPEISRPDFRKLRACVSDCLEKWHELPIFHLGLGSIVDNLINLFENREEVHVKEIVSLLENIGYPKSYFAKIQGRLVRVTGDTASRGYMLGTLREMIRQIEKSRVENFTRWKSWARNQGILWSLALDGNCERVE